MALPAWPERETRRKASLAGPPCLRIFIRPREARHLVRVMSQAQSQLGPWTFPSGCPQKCLETRGSRGPSGEARYLGTLDTGTGQGMEGCAWEGTPDSGSGGGEMDKGKAEEGEGGSLGRKEGSWR